MNLLEMAFFQSVIWFIDQVQCVRKSYCLTKMEYPTIYHLVQLNIQELAPEVSF